MIQLFYSFTFTEINFSPDFAGFRESSTVIKEFTTGKESLLCRVADPDPGVWSDPDPGVCSDPDPVVGPDLDTGVLSDLAPGVWSDPEPS